MIMHQLKLYHFRHLNQATLGGEETKHAELLSIKWLLLNQDMQSALKHSPAAPFGADAGSVMTSEYQKRSCALQVPAGSDEYAQERGDLSARSSAEDGQSALQLEDKTKAGARWTEIVSSGGEKSLPVVHEHECGDAGEETGGLYKEMQEIKKERDLERERVRAKEEEMERDRLRMEDERESSKAEVKELKKKLAGRVGDEGEVEVRAVAGQTAPEDTDGEEMERLLEENMVRCLGLSLSLLLPLICMCYLV